LIFRKRILILINRRILTEDEILNRIVSLLLTAVVVFIALSLLGVIIYAGIFIFLGIIFYMLVITIKNEFCKHKCKRKIDVSRVIDMGEVEIIIPNKDE